MLLHAPGGRQAAAGLPLSQLIIRGHMLAQRAGHSAARTQPALNNASTPQARTASLPSTPAPHLLQQHGVLGVDLLQYRGQLGDACVERARLLIAAAVGREAVGASAA